MWFLSTLFIVVNKNLARNIQDRAAYKQALNLLLLVTGFRVKECYLPKFCCLTCFNTKIIKRLNPVGRLKEWDL